MRQIVFRDKKHQRHRTVTRKWRERHSKGKTKVYRKVCKGLERSYGNWKWVRRKQTKRKLTEVKK